MKELVPGVTKDVVRFGTYLFIMKELVPGVTKDVVRCGDFPDDIMLHIFSFMDTKFVVRTCLRIKQFNHLWTKLPTLNFQFFIHSRSTDFFLNVLRRSELCTRQCFNLKFDTWIMQPHESFLNSIIDEIELVESRRVQQLDIDFANRNYNFSFSTLSSCRWLKVLRVNKCHFYGVPLNFPMLKILQFKDACFKKSEENNSFLLSCANLEKLVLWNVNTDIEKCELVISCPKLVSLGISGLGSDFTRIKISAPRLATFNYNCTHPCVMSVEDANSPWQLETVNLDMYNLPEDYIINTLKLLSSLKSLTLTSKTIKVLTSSVPSLLEKTSFLFKNLKTLKLEVNEKDEPLIFLIR